MLSDFIASHRELIVDRTRAKVALRVAPRASDLEREQGVPLFLDQFSARLRKVEMPHVRDTATGASRYGSDLLAAGFTIGQVVHAYGDICQVLAEVAGESGMTITTEDFKKLNLCLDVAIAEAVTEYARLREEKLVGRGVEQLGFLAHELRNLLNTATLAFEVLRTGNVDIGGRTGLVVAKSLAGMDDLVTRTLAEVRLEAGPPRTERISLGPLMEEIEIAAGIQAKARNIRLSIEPTPDGLAVEGDTQLVASIVANLVQNACKFTRKHGRVIVATRATDDRVAIDVSDQCGGLPPGKAEELFRPYEQRGSDRSGLGLGLAISMKAARAMGAELSVRDLPGTGCVFSLALRRATTTTL